MIDFDKLLEYSKQFYEEAKYLLNTTHTDYHRGSMDGIDRIVKLIERQKEKQSKEWIICAANYYNDNKKHEHQPTNIGLGFVTCGRRHHNCISTFAQIVGFPYSDEANEIHNTEIQGFLTNTNRFVDRKEAYKIAFYANQIIGPNKGYPTNEIGLTSEDLY